MKPLSMKLLINFLRFTLQEKIHEWFPDDLKYKNDLWTNLRTTTNRLIRYNFLNITRVLKSYT